MTRRTISRTIFWCTIALIGGIWISTDRYNLQCMGGLLVFFGIFFASETSSKDEE